MTSHITKFIRDLNKREEYCHLLEMTNINDDSKVQVFISSMYDSDMFTELEMNTWETAWDKSWAAAQAYFIGLYKSKKNFTKQRANRQQGYDSAASVTEQSLNRHFGQQSDSASLPASVITSASGMTLSEQQSMAEYTTALEARLDDKEKEFAAAMTTTQSNVMEQFQQQQKLMMDQQQKFMEGMMQKLMTNNTTGGGGGNQNGGGGKQWERTGPKCPHCGKQGKHAEKPDTCLSLEKNKDKRPPNWKF